MLFRGVLGGGNWMGFAGVSNSFSFGSDCAFLETFRAGNRAVELSFDIAELSFGVLHDLETEF